MSLALKSQEDEAGQIQNLRFHVWDQKAAQPDAAPVDLVGHDPVVEGRFDVRCASRP